MFFHRCPSPRQIASAIWSEYDNRKRRLNSPRVERVTKNAYKQGRPVRVVKFNDTPFRFGPVNDNQAPAEVSVSYDLEYEQWLCVLEFDQYWERKNGRETGRLLREEFVRVVSKTQTNKRIAP